MQAPGAFDTIHGQYTLNVPESSNVLRGIEVLYSLLIQENLKHGFDTGQTLFDYSASLPPAGVYTAIHGDMLLYPLDAVGTGTLLHGAVTTYQLGQWMINSGYQTIRSTIRREAQYDATSCLETGEIELDTLNTLAP